MSHQVKLHLRKFDMSSIADDKVIVMIGKRETGKSFLVRDLMYHHRDVPIGTVISGTELANRFFGSMVPPVFIHDEITSELLSNVVKRQETMIRIIEKQKETYGSCSIDPRAFLILDDCMYDNTWIKDKNIRLLFMNGRHYRISFVVTMQYPLGVPPALRTQIDYVFILRENLLSNRKRIYENYAGMFPSFDVFCQVMNQCTENFECIVINNNAKSNRLSDQVFWYKAGEQPPFRIGAPEFWTLSRDCEASRQQAALGYGGSEEDEDRGDDMCDIMNMPKRGKGPLVSVRKSLQL
jgi:hypothetical protein